MRTQTIASLTEDSSYVELSLSKPQSVRLPDREIFGGRKERDVPLSSSATLLTPTTNALESFEISETTLPMVESTQSVWKPYMNRFRLVSACVTALLGGLNDSALGALIPHLEADYSIGYAVVSIIFVSIAFGFMGAAFFVSTMTRKYGHSKALMFAEFLRFAGFIALICRPPFAVTVLAFFCIGMGAATTLAVCQVWCANLQNGSLVSGIYQGMYGVGGTIGPLIATSIVSKGHHWSTFYFLTLGLVTISFCLAGWAFWSHENDSPPHASATDTAPLSGWTRLKRIITNKPTLFGSFFIFAYQGSEVAISGWIISFLVSYRGGDVNKVGYVTAGFWAGITLGRFILSHFGPRIGERNFIIGLTAGAFVLELVVWFVPSIIGNSIALAVSGFLLGPIYPAATAVLIRLIPKQMQVSSFSFIASVGSSGGAFIPFMTGLLAQQAGTWVLHPICISLFVSMEILWFIMPKPVKRLE